MVTSNLGTRNEHRVSVKLHPAGSNVDSATPASGAAVAPLATTSDPASFCSNGGYDRAVISELQDYIFGCLDYGMYDQTTGDIIWQRYIQWEWNMYPGWPSAQNTLRTIPETGSPVMSGSFTSFKQNGILDPTPLAYSLFTNTGNAFTSGWNVGSLNSDGQFSVWMGDIHVVDSQKGYDEWFEGSIASHRFTCQSSNDRCFFPNGQEAGL